jgi:GNAT superfamily N-acetyltransferase
VETLNLQRLDYSDPRAAELRALMDDEMTALYAGVSASNTPEIEALVDAALTIHPESMVATVGVFDGDLLVGHAALRPFEDSYEVKRVIVRKSHRGRGISKLLMRELEVIAQEQGVTSLVLQTGGLQTEAIGLYLSLGYVPIERFGLYAPVPFFLCYGKDLA